MLNDMPNILEKKSSENAEVAEEFIKGTRLNTALSRTYYAVFQKIKGILITNKNFCLYYKDNPVSYNVKDKDGREFEKEYKLFEHGFMPQILEYFANYTKQPYNKDKFDEISDDITFLYNKRRESDYSENTFFVHTNKSNKILADKALEKMRNIIDFIDANIADKAE